MNWSKVKEIVDQMTPGQLENEAVVWVGGDYGFQMDFFIEEACDVHSEGHTFDHDHPLITPIDNIEDIAKHCINSMASKLSDAAPFFSDSCDREQNRAQPPTDR